MTFLKLNKTGSTCVVLGRRSLNKITLKIGCKFMVRDLFNKQVGYTVILLCLQSSKLQVKDESKTS